MTDATAGRGGVGIRLYTSGGDLVRRTFDQVGDSGKKMWAEIALGERAANPAIRALNAGANEARGGVDGLASRAGTAGNMLGAFGFAGVGAAAALGGLTLAMGKAREAMAFADEIDDAAQTLGIGTSALQEYRFAMTEVGGATTDADRAIEGFQKKLGEAMAGGRAKKWFDQIGIGPDQLSSFKSTEDALGDVLDRISKLGTEAERAAVAEKLGLGPMVVLARDGTVALEGLRQKARDIGYVMDEDLVKKGADANQKFETMAQIIDVQLKSAFVGLSDEVLTFTGYIAAALGKLNEFVGNFNEQKAKITSILGKDTVDALMRGDNAEAAIHLSRRVASGDVSRMQNAWANGETDVDDPMLQRGRAANEALQRPNLNTGGNHLQDRSGGGRASKAAGEAAKAEREAEQRRQRSERVADQIDRLGDDVLKEMEGEYRTIAERHGFARDRLEDEARERDLAIQRGQEEFARTKGLRGISDVEAAILREKEGLLTAAKLENDRQKERREQAARQLQDDETAAQAAVDMRGIDADLAKTAGERARIQREILIIEQKIARDRLEQQLKNDNELNDGQIAGRLRDFDRRAVGELTVFDNDEQERLRQQFKSYGLEVVNAIQDGRIGEYIGDQLKAKLLDGALNSLFAMMSGGSKSESGSSGFWNTAIKFGASLLGGGKTGAGTGSGDISKLFRSGGGKASGGDAKASFAYGLAEHGPELFMLGGNGHITSAAETAKMVRDMSGYSQGAATQASAPVIHMAPITISADGADPTALNRLKEEVRNLNRTLEQRAVEAVADWRARSHGA